MIANATQGFQHQSHQRALTVSPAVTVTENGSSDSDISSESFFSGLIAAQGHKATK